MSISYCGFYELKRVGVYNPLKGYGNLIGTF